MAIQINGSGSITGITTRLAAAAAPAGSVIQTVSSHKSDVFTTTSDTPVDISGTDEAGSGTVWECNITPTADDSKILVIVYLGMLGNVTGGYSTELTLVRDSTNIALGDAEGSSRPRVTLSANDSTSWGHSAGNITFLDSPGTDSAITYKLQMSSQGGLGTALLNRRGDDASDNASYQRSGSSITLLEIAV